MLHPYRHHCTAQHSTTLKLDQTLFAFSRPRLAGTHLCCISEGRLVTKSMHVYVLVDRRIHHRRMVYLVCTTHIHRRTFWRIVVCTMCKVIGRNRTHDPSDNLATMDSDWLADTPEIIHNDFTLKLLSDHHRVCLYYEGLYVNLFLS